MAQTRIMKRQQIFKTGIAAGMALVGFVCLSCGDNDPSVIVGAQLRVTADPNPICLGSGTTSAITATCFDILGGERAGVTVDFTTTGGGVVPSSGVSDSAGKVATVFTVSPAVAGTATVTTVAESLSTPVAILVLDPNSHVLASPDASIDTTCSEGIILNGTLLDSAAAPMAGKEILFTITSSTPANLTGAFTPFPVVTDGTGAYTATFVLDGTLCASSCTSPAGPCTIIVRTNTNANCSKSNEVTITTAL